MSAALLQELLDVLRDALPVLKAEALAETRRMKGPAGQLHPSTDKRDLLKRARLAIVNGQVECRRHASSADDALA